MIKIQIKEIAEQKQLNISQVQRGARLDMGLVRRYWYNQSTSVDLRAIEKIFDFFKQEGLDITIADLFVVTDN